MVTSCLYVQRHGDHVQTLAIVRAPNRRRGKSEDDEICTHQRNILRNGPPQERQAKDALKLLKKSLGNKNSKVQILALYVLENLMKKINKIVLALEEGLQCRGAAGM